MSRDDVATYVEKTFVAYRGELLSSGMSSEDADANIARNRSQQFNGDDLVSGQFILDVVSGDDVVGTLWLGLHNGVGPDWWIYEIEISERFRGTGYGRPTLAAAEEFVRAQGGTRLGLNVFGTNAVARHLYEAAGYSVANIEMYKEF
ncbi:MAG TPA: GNAT family N-acetyltransferase [Acidimicrobiales bacterium]|jgi:ribosomal protein S18 acetylase RimI-like enzyme